MTRVALIARSGQDLARFGQRYSHAGLSLAGSANAPWSVRQLFFSCDEKRPRLFDQGIAGFVLGTENPSLGYVSLLLLPPEVAAPLEQRALDNAYALRLLAGTYSANAYPFEVHFQNCNQWVAELLASTWGDLPDGADLRRRAQAWLREQGYVPTVFDVGSPFIMMLGWFIPYVHSLDHPLEDRAQSIYRVSMPASLEAFVQARVPGAERVEICHDERKVVLRRGGVPTSASERASPIRRSAASAPGPRASWANRCIAAPPRRAGCSLVASGAWYRAPAPCAAKRPPTHRLLS